MAEIEVLQPGLFSTIQDNGRFGYMKFGVPQSGPMDKYAAKMCNLLLRNSPENAILEITQMGPKLKFHGRAKIVICGADLSARLDGKPVLLDHPILVKSGGIVDFGGRKNGCRTYLGISGGFLEVNVLRSKSWYEDLTDNYRLEKGRKLQFQAYPSLADSTNAAIKVESDYIHKKEITAFPGPEYYLLSREERELLESRDFTVDRKNNRMAIQLTEPLENKLSPILTGPVVPGTVQLTPSGKIIVLMRDCQTTGGYPRILQLTEMGINSLAQKITDEKISFTLEERIR